MDLIFIAAFGLFCIGLGAMGYRYLLKSDPETLERWAREAKAAGDFAKRKLDDL